MTGTEARRPPEEYICGIIDTGTLLARLPDAPRWIHARGLLATGKAQVHAMGPECWLVEDERAPWAFAVGDPSVGLAAFLESRPDVRSLLVLPDVAGAVEEVLSWRRTRAVLHLHPEPAAIPPPDRPVSRLGLADVPLLEDFSDELRKELEGALARATPFAAVVAGERAVSCAYVATETDRFWDVSVDTLEAHRRRGHAAACFAALVPELLARGKRPVWGALEDNVESLALAAKLGFEPVDEIAVFEAG